MLQRQIRMLDGILDMTLRQIAACKDLVVMVCQGFARAGRPGEKTKSLGMLAGDVVNNGQILRSFDAMRLVEARHEPFHVPHCLAIVACLTVKGTQEKGMECRGKAAEQDPAAPDVTQ